MPRPIRVIVAGVAEPEARDLTLAAAAQAAAASGAALHLVHVADFPPVLWGDGEGAYADARAAREAELRACLERAARSAAPGVKVTAWIAHGAPGEALLDAAEDLLADLVVVGASHRGPLGQALLGTAAQRVLRGSPVPVLVVRGSPVPPRRVLLTTDLSAASAAVHEAGLDTIEAMGGGHLPEVRSLVAVLHSLMPPPLPREVLETAAEAQLGEFLELRRRRAYPADPAVRVGEPYAAISAEAAEWGADLVVLGTHGRSAVERFFLGSVAEAVLRAVPCNALVVPPAAAQAEVAAHAEAAGAAV